MPTPRNRLWAGCGVAAILALSAATAHGQTTADGLQALVRADYVAAARILTPLAESTDHPDPIAQFLAASLFQAGRGVAVDPLRACGLYLTAASLPGPLHDQARSLAEAMLRDFPAARCESHRVAIVTDRTRTFAAQVAGVPPVTAGVATFLRGDYQMAADILRPIAEASPSRDHVAEFFMAALYDGHHGSAADEMRACALYVRTSADPSSPFGVQAETFAEGFNRAMTPETFRQCMTVASVGFDLVVRPVTFALEPDHWVAIDGFGATVSYSGTEERSDLSVDVGSVRIATEHTELPVTGSLLPRRHFIEFFTWTPIDDTWHLEWEVYEVVRTLLVRVTGEDLFSVRGERPPPDPGDFRALARLRVDDRGRAEWLVVGGSGEKHGFIPTAAEQRQHDDRKKARDAAQARIDWSKRFEVTRTPSLAYADVEGCGNVFLFGWSENRAEIITVAADKDLLALSETPRTFNLAATPGSLELAIHVYDRPIRNWPFCTDVGEPRGPTETWTVVAGSATIEIAPEISPFAQPGTYRATVRIVGAEFLGDSGTRVRQIQPITLTATVGLMPGN